MCHHRVIMKQPDLCCECSRLEILAALCPKRTLKGRWRRGPFNVRYRSAARVRAPPSPRLFDRRSTTIVRLLSVRLAGHGTRQQPRSRGLLREARTRHRAPRSLHLSRSHSSPIPLLRRDDEIASAFIVCHAAALPPATPLFRLPPRIASSSAGHRYHTDPTNGAWRAQSHFGVGHM